ncbi:MAG: hypothetical protein QXY45_00470 [Candidatus Aenigmatarchaeota archaeon]
MDYKNIGLRIGLEIHHELDTHGKLFCACSTLLKTKEKPDFLIERKQIPVFGEMGEIDEAALIETKKIKKIIYEVFEDCDCLIDIDEEPPKQPNKDALEIALTIAELLHCKIVDEIHIMRKTIIDGSLPSGFQRTMMIGFDGWIETSKGRVEIESVSLEEDSGRLTSIEDGIFVFRLDRVGTPEVEISVGMGIISPEHAMEVAKLIGDIIRCTGRAKIREGSVRQDVNVSIKDGDRVEIKHVPSLSMIPVVIQKEIERQKKIIESGMKVKREVRKVLPDGSTEFLRPLSSSARMYPETDCLPIDTEIFLEKIRKNLPETFDKKIERYQKTGLSKDMATQILETNYYTLFEYFIQKFDIDANIIANVFVNTLKDLKRREGLDVEFLEKKDFEDLFKILSNKKIMKESIPDILKMRILNSGLSIEECVEKMGIKTISIEDLSKLVKEIISNNSGSSKEKIIGLVMSKVRGKADPKDVINLVEKEIGLNK